MIPEVDDLESENSSFPIFDSGSYDRLSTMLTDLDFESLQSEIALFKIQTGDPKPRNIKKRRQTIVGLSWRTSNFFANIDPSKSVVTLARRHKGNPLTEPLTISNSQSILGSDVSSITISSAFNPPGQSHVEYEVKIDFFDSETRTSSALVHRRFSDFILLRDALTTSFPFLFVPPLPPKDVFKKRSDYSLVRTRIRLLENFLLIIIFGGHSEFIEHPATALFFDPAYTSNEFRSTFIKPIEPMDPEVLFSNFLETSTEIPKVETHNLISSLKDNINRFHKVIKSRIERSEKFLKEKDSDLNFINKIEGVPIDLIESIIERVAAERVIEKKSIEMLKTKVLEPIEFIMSLFTSYKSMKKYHQGVKKGNKWSSKTRKLLGTIEGLEMAYFKNFLQGLFAFVLETYNAIVP